MKSRTEIETHLHEAEAFSAHADELYKRVRQYDHLPMMRLCSETQQNLSAAIACFRKAMATAGSAPLIDFLHLEGVDRLHECDWAFYDIECAIRRLEGSAAKCG